MNKTTRIQKKKNRHTAGERSRPYRLHHHHRLACRGINRREGHGTLEAVLAAGKYASWRDKETWPEEGILGCCNGNERGRSTAKDKTATARAYVRVRLLNTAAVEVPRGELRWPPLHCRLPPSPRLKVGLCRAENVTYSGTAVPASHTQPDSSTIPKNTVHLQPWLPSLPPTPPSFHPRVRSYMRKKFFARISSHASPFK